MKTSYKISKMKTITAIFSLIILLNVQNLFAQTSSVTAAFVDVGVGARPASMGGAFVGLADDINSVLWNPAGLTNISEKQASFSSAKVFGLINYSMLTFGMPMNAGDELHQGLGASLLYSGDDALREMTITAGYARIVGPVSLGANLKYRYASFGKNTLNRDDYTAFSDEEFQQGVLDQVKGKANGFGLDLGLLYQFSNEIRMGLMLRDILAPVSWNSSTLSKKADGKYTESVPFETVVGTSYKVFEELMITADYQPSMHKDVDNIIRGGAELRLFKFLYVRAGLQNIINNINDEKYVIGFGFKFGISKSKIGLDYTYLNERIANSSRITLSFSF